MRESVGTVEKSNKKCNGRAKSNPLKRLTVNISVLINDLSMKISIVMKRKTTYGRSTRVLLAQFRGKFLENTFVR